MTDEFTVTGFKMPDHSSTHINPETIHNIEIMDIMSDNDISPADKFAQSIRDAEDEWYKKVVKSDPALKKIAEHKLGKEYFK